MISIFRAINSVITGAIVNFLELCYEREFMLAITANDLKRNGVSDMERAMLGSEDSQVFVDVRGKA